MINTTPATTSSFTEAHIPLVQALLKGAKVTASKHQTTQRSYNFLSEINRWSVSLSWTEISDENLFIVNI